MEFTGFNHDQASDAEFAELAAFLAAMDAVDRPWHTARTPEALAAYLKERQSTAYDVSIWVARESADAGDHAGRLTATAWLGLALSEENAGTATMDLRVHPEFRRRGIGTAFLRALIPELRAAGRDHLIGSGDSRGSAELWGATVGLVPALRHLQQELRFADVDRSLWDRPLAPGYRLESWTDHAPESLLESYGVARQAIDDAVSGDLRWKDPQWTPERVRYEEERVLEAGCKALVVVAIDEAGGEVAGVTDVIYQAPDPVYIDQNYTAVRREHRGRGLGLAMKATLLRALAEAPTSVHVTTGTGDLVRMAAINRELGFRDLVESVYVEADLDVIEAALSSDSSGTSGS